MYANDRHTDLDLARFAVEGINPDRVQPRKQPVCCPWCPRTGRATVWNLSGLCDRHEAAEDRLITQLGLGPDAIEVRPVFPRPDDAIVIDLRDDGDDGHTFRL